MEFPEEDRKKLIAAIDKMSVKHWMTALQNDFDRYGELDDEEKQFYASNLKEYLKDTPEISEVKSGYVLVETSDMRIELINGNLEVNPI